jgi:hypothetical protein
LVLPFFLEA